MPGNISEELNKCYLDFVYFCEKYVKLNQPSKGLISFKLFDYQKRYINELEKNKYLIGTKFRRGGFTTLTSVWYLWRCLFKLNEVNVIMSNSDKESKHISHMIKKIYDCLPEFITYNRKIDFKGGLLFSSTNSKILFVDTEVFSLGSITNLYIDDAAFINGMQNRWELIYPTLSNGAKCCIMSTPNGKNNWFCSVYTNAGYNAFRVFNCSYKEHPDYNDGEWAFNMKEALGEVGWRQEVLCEFFDTQIFYNEFIWDTASNTLKSDGPPVANWLPVGHTIQPPTVSIPAKNFTKTYNKISNILS